MNMKTRVLIAEDEPLAAEALAEWVAQLPQLELVSTCADGAAALAQIRALQPELVLMDIHMPGLTGLQVLSAIAAEGLRPAVIFTTAYDEHALTAFELHAVDYLLKPFSRERFDEAVEHALARQGTPAPIEELDARAQVEPLVRIFVRDRGAIIPVAVGAIEYFQSDHKYTSIYSNGKTYLVRVPSRICTTSWEFSSGVIASTKSRLTMQPRCRRRKRVGSRRCRRWRRRRARRPSR